MGCNGSKPEDLPLVVRCRQRRDLVRAAANHRYALAAAHVSYFHSLKHVGDALRKFVDEELVLGSSSSSELSESSVSSPSLILPPNWKKKRSEDVGAKELPSSSSPSSSSQLRKRHEDADVDSHLDISDSSSSDDDDELDSEDHGQHHHGHRHHDQHHHHHDDDYPRSKGFGNEAVHGHMNGENAGGGNFNRYSGNFNNGFGPPYPDPYAYPSSFPFSYPPSYVDPWDPRDMMPQWRFPANSDNIYYMKKSAPATRTVIQEPPRDPNDGVYSSYWGDPPQGYSSNYGFFPTGGGEGTAPARKEAPPPPPPPEPNVSAWDFFNPFDGFDNVYSGNYYSGPEFQSNTSSPDSTEVRVREGIPDLEEETESEVYKEVLNGKKSRGEGKRSMAVHRSHDDSPSSSKSVYMSGKDSWRSSKPSHKSEGSSRSSKTAYKTNKGESTSKSVPSQSGEESEKPSLNTRSSEGSGKTSMHYVEEESIKKPVSPVHSNGASWVDPSPDLEIPGSFHLSDGESSTESVVLKSVDEGSVTKKKGVTFELGETSKHDGDSSILSSVTSLSPHGNRNLKEVVAEIRDEFETASGFGKEVAVMLEVGKLPYRPSILKAIASRMMYIVSPSLSLDDPPSTQSAKLASRTSKLAKMYFEDVGNDVNAQACNLSSTMDKLYAWEQKLYKEVKDEERLRVMYEKQCKRLKVLVEEGAEASKIDAARASSRKLLTKLDVSIKAIDSVSARIHKLRDEELEPQVTALIHGLINMWKAMLKCHRKQFQAIMESKMRKLKAKTTLQPDSNSQATVELEHELRTWCEHFKKWITFQKSYAESLNNWVLQCLQYETEETPDGPIPYSPGRLGAPPIFVICNDWKQAMESVSGSKVSNAMNTFATSLRQFWERQDEEGRLRLNAEYLTKDYEKKVRTQHDEDSMSVVRSDPLDDLKVDLDTMKQKVAEERVKHKDAMKLVHEAASSSLQGGLVPIFKALESFSRQAVEAHGHVRLARDS